MDKLIHDIRCALDIITVCISMYMQEDGTEKRQEKRSRHAQNNRIGMVFAAMKGISMNKNISMSERIEGKRTLDASFESAVLDSDHFR